MKPVDYDNDVAEYLERIAMLAQQLKDSEDKCDAIQSACERYLEEEEILKAELEALKQKLEEEKMERLKMEANLRLQISNWEIKYELEIEEVKNSYQDLLSFTDLEREVNQQVIVGYDKRVKYYQNQLRSVQNILRTPRLTRIYQHEMAKKIKLHSQEVQALIKNLNSQSDLVSKKSLVTRDGTSMPTALALDSH